MSVAVSVALFVVGLGLVICFAKKLVKATVGTSIGFGISTFLVSVIFIGFDPENLAVGAVSSAQGIAGIALGSIIGATMVAIALAFGITALITPMRFEQAPKRVLVVPVSGTLLFGLLVLDGEVARIDVAFCSLALLSPFSISFSWAGGGLTSGLRERLLKPLRKPRRRASGNL